MLKKILIATLFLGFMDGYAFANTSLTLFSSTAPVEITPNGGTNVQIGLDETVNIFYMIRNLDTKPHRFSFNNIYPTGAVSRLAFVPQNCNFSVELPGGATCQLGLLITGSRIPAGGIVGGPQICSAGLNVCSQPNQADVLRVNHP